MQTGTLEYTRQSHPDSDHRTGSYTKCRTESGTIIHGGVIYVNRWGIHVHEPGNLSRSGLGGGREAGLGVDGETTTGALGASGIY